MQEQSFTLYADWSRERRRWMIVDETDFQPLISEESVEKLMEACRRRRQSSPVFPDGR